MGQYMPKIGLNAEKDSPSTAQNKAGIALDELFPDTADRKPLR